MKHLFAQPTAPFCEQFVLREIEAIAREKRLPYFRDKFGNLIVGVRHAHALKLPKVLFFAHTDHPGFHVLRQSGRTVSARWMGGAPFAQMVGAKVAIYDPVMAVKVAKARVVSLEKKTYKRSGLKIKLQLEKNTLLPRHAFGAFDFPAYKSVRHRVTTRVADDLAGCVIALGAVMDARKNSVAVFTRAEEVGYIGCLAWLKAHKVSQKSIALSLEASKTLPGALLGKGPVLRLGDRSTLFDQSASQFLLHCAVKLKSTKFQRRIMDGGSCEATALNAFGLRTTGMSVPLDNYHNQGKRGPAPEIIDKRDVEGARQICATTARRLHRFPSVSGQLVKTLEKNYRQLNKFLNLYYEAKA